jgi:acyl-coenzyme A thioesterase 13
MSTPAEGFEPLFRSGPFLDLIGPIYQQKRERSLVIGLRIEEKHCNARGNAHGGILSTLADIALGYNLAFSSEPPTPIVTSSLSIDYVSSVRLGDWLEVHSDIQKLGRQVAFANCFFFVEDKRVARASGVFSVVGG